MLCLASVICAGAVACSQRSQPGDATAEVADSPTSPADDADRDVTDPSDGFTLMDAQDAVSDASAEASTVDGDGSSATMDAARDGEGGMMDAFQVPSLGDAACGAAITQHMVQESPHVDFDASMYDAAINWNSNPPSSGPHFGLWAYWGIYPTPIPRGYYVHNLEHGGVVLSYRCASRAASAQCTAMHDQLAAFVNGLPPEPACVGTGVRRRIILTPDPSLTTTVGGSAWGYTYNASCVDTRSLEIFVLSLTGRAPEDFCADGFYPEPPPPPMDAGRDSG
jgi:hypothetical protein